MKIKKLLFATLLCGAFGMFTACSDDDGPIDLPDTNEPVAEEVDTYLALATNVDNGNLSTRAGADDVKDTDNSVNQITSLAVAVFNVENDKPTKILYFDIQKSVKPDNQEEKEAKGYYLNPIKFKIAAGDETEKSKVAVVVLANFGSLFDNKTENTKLTDFDSFVNFTRANMDNNKGIQYYGVDGIEHPVYPDGTVQYPINYPMSSNVYYFTVKPGAVNSVGYKDPKNALDFAKSHYTDDDFDGKTLYPSQYPMIDLYRGAAEVELKTLKFEDYGDMAFDHFILEEVFVMNAPTMVNWFDPTLPTDKSNYSKEWGGDLNIDFASYKTMKFGSKNAFLSGNKRIIQSANPAAGSIPFLPGEFCSREIYNNRTNNYFIFDFVHNLKNYREDAEKSELSFYENADNDYFGMFTQKSKDYTMKLDVAGKLKDAYEAIKFAVSPNNYSLKADGSLDSEKAICLVVRGRYYYKSEGIVMGPDLKDQSASRYWTVVVNKAGESAIKDNSVPQHYNCVKRNVRYEIALTINGPGSETPWGYDKNSYVVPKVTIVPFGTVEQNSTLD